MPFERCRLAEKIHSFPNPLRQLGKMRDAHRSRLIPMGSPEDIKKGTKGRMKSESHRRRWSGYEHSDRKEEESEGRIVFLRESLMRYKEEKHEQLKIELAVFSIREKIGAKVGFFGNRAEVEGSDKEECRVQAAAKENRRIHQKTWPNLILLQTAI